VPDWPPYDRKPTAVADGIDWFADRDNYTAAFGAQWLRHANTQLDSHSGLPITRDRVERLLGPLWPQLPGMLVLEAGCGSGRFTEVILDQGSVVTSFDLSRAVEANRRQFDGNERHRVFGGSILDIPFAPGQYDLVFCPGVIQHTPDTEASIAALWRQVRPGGWLVFDHYRHNLSTWTRSVWLFRAVFRRLPPERGLQATEALVRWLLPVHRRVSGHRLVEMVLNRVSPVTSYYSSFPGLSDKDQLEWARLDTHDNLTDFYKRHRTEPQLRRTVEALGAVDVVTDTTRYVVEVRARKPA
jgi:SAM-dependent methyltransferase